ncbi:MAG: signal peptidase II [Candidatus Mariimomonas ferrooxydans]
MQRGAKRLKNWYDSKVFLMSAVSLSVVILDFITKKIIETHVQPGEIINLLPFLRIVNVKNKGAAFGLFSGLSNNTFIFISVVAIIAIILYMLKTSKRLELLSLSLILGGAVGNLTDRIQIGQVIDFIDFFVYNWHWPAFNVADSALSIGIILFILSGIIHGKKGEDNS